MHQQIGIYLFTILIYVRNQIHEEGVVDAFEAIGPFLKLYAIYADNFEAALAQVSVRPSSKKIRH